MTGCQNDKVNGDDNRPRHTVISLLLEEESYGVDEPSHARILHTLQTFPHKPSLQVMVNRRNSLQPQRLYRYFRALGLLHLQFTPVVEFDERQQLKTHSVRPDEWGHFLLSVFNIWVREDVGSVHIQLFDSTLDTWCGYSSTTNGGEREQVKECRQCTVLPFCQGDCPKHRNADGKSALCEGYRQFFTHSAPYMKAMRDLLKQRRSPVELMVMLNQSR